MVSKVAILVPSATVHSYNMVLIITRKPSCSTTAGLITSSLYVQYFACICNFSDRLLSCVTIAFIIVLYCVLAYSAAKLLVYL